MYINYKCPMFNSYVDLRDGTSHVLYWIHRFTAWPQFCWLNWPSNPDVSGKGPGVSGVTAKVEWIQTIPPCPWILVFQPLAMCCMAIEHTWIFPFNMVIFHSHVAVYQRVTSSLVRPGVFTSSTYFFPKKTNQQNPGNIPWASQLANKHSIHVPNFQWKIRISRESHHL